MATGNSFWYLENIDVTGIFCPKKIGENEQHVAQEFKKGEYIYLPETDSDKIFFVFEGRIKIGSYNENGKEVTKTILGQGEVFGELSLIGEEKRRDFAIAMQKSTLCSIPVNDMRAIIKDHSQLNLFLMRLMGSRMMEMEQRLESLVFKDSRTRIVEFLYQLGIKKGQKVGFETLVRQFFTHQEIANLTATSRQTVTTILNDLRNKNIITFNRKRLLIRDMENLKKEYSS